MGATCFAMFVWVCAAPQTAQSQLLFCDGAQPITWSAHDTRATKDQIDAHNRVWLRFCGGAK